jgi:uncharacterized protein YndB with AHSA1/START domain
MMGVRGRPLHFLASVLLFASGPALAAADDPPPSRGFVVYETTVVKAGPDAVWAALVRPARWWNREHSWSGDAANLTLDPRAGGCFCETLPDGGSAEHMHVVQWVPGSLLRMKGALGPLQSEALEGVLTIELKPGEGSTTITWAYVVGGYSRLPLGDIAPAVDSVLGEQAERLAALVEFGDPDHLTQR